MNAEELDGYSCDECAEIYRYEEDAENCCRFEPSTTKKKVYSCSKCDELHEDKEDAEECCKEEEKK